MWTPSCAVEGDAESLHTECCTTTGMIAIIIYDNTSHLQHICNKSQCHKWEQQRHSTTGESSLHCSSVLQGQHLSYWHPWTMHTEQHRVQSLRALLVLCRSATKHGCRSTLSTVRGLLVESDQATVWDAGESVQEAVVGQWPEQDGKVNEAQPTGRQGRSACMTLKHVSLQV